MNIKFIIFLILSFFYLRQNIIGQDFGFSQYHFTPFLTNPALLASENYLNLRLHYRNQPTPDGQNIQTPMFSFSTALLNNKTNRRWGGLGLSILQDKATNFMNTFGGTAAFAYNFKLKNNQLALGLQAGYFRRTLDIQNLSTFSQYQSGIFNASLPNNENLQNTQAGFFNLSTGVLFYKENEEGDHRYFIGITGANLNQPSLKYSNNDVVKIPIFFNIHGGVNLMPDNHKFIIMPNARYNNFSQNNIINIGSWIRMKTIDSEGFIKKGSIGVGLWYNTNQAMITSLEFMQPNYIIALSYDFSLSQNSQVWQRNGSTEITLGFRKKLQPKKCSDKDGDGFCDKDDECPDEAGLPEFNGCPDRDKDGIPDKKDDCPDEFGLKEFNGCPDRDKDGVMDKDDNCPDEFGLKEFNGCPDRDKDGIMDKDDNCPDEFGLKEFNGCPDRDKDGVMDKDDNCPDEFGLKELKGCPEKEDKITKEEEAILEKASHVQFKTNESIILPNSYSILDEVVELLKRHPNGFLSLEGHTDNVGKPEKNLKLSEERANAVKKYFIDKGIDSERITTKGFGITKPKTTNETPEGRAENRRVEMKFQSKK